MVLSYVSSKTIAKLKITSKGEKHQFRFNFQNKCFSPYYSYQALVNYISTH